MYFSQIKKYNSTSIPTMQPDSHSGDINNDLKNIEELFFKKSSSYLSKNNSLSLNSCKTKRMSKVKTCPNQEVSEQILPYLGKRLPI